MLLVSPSQSVTSLLSTADNAGIEEFRNVKPSEITFKERIYKCKMSLVFLVTVGNVECDEGGEYCSHHSSMHLYPDPMFELQFRGVSTTIARPMSIRSQRCEQIRHLQMRKERLPSARSRRSL